MLRTDHPRQIIALRRVFCIGTVKTICTRVEVSEHEPRAGCVVNVIRIVMASERIPGIKNAGRTGALRNCEIKMILPHELPKVRRAEEFLLRTEGIIQVKIINAELVRHNDTDIIRHSAGNPVMSADRLEPPDFIAVRKADAVLFVCAVLFRQLTETEDTFSRRVNIRKYKNNKVLFPDSSGLFGLSFFLFLIYHKRISPEHTLVRRDRLCCRHRDIRRVDAAGRPDANSRDRVRHGCVALRVVRKVNLHMGENRFIMTRLLLRLDDNEFLRREMTGTGIIIS